MLVHQNTRLLEILDQHLQKLLHLFHYIFEKEKQHCCCNLLPGIMKGPEMWEILSVFAPKPLLVEQGEQDFLFPNEYARRNARKVKNVYVQLGAEENFMLAITQTAHSWECVDREVISRFLCQALNVEFVAVENDVDITLLAQIESWKVDIPEDSYDTARVAASLTGVTMPEGTELSDIYPPVYKGRKIIASELLEETERGNTMRVLAQMECAL